MLALYVIIGILSVGFYQTSIILSTYRVEFEDLKDQVRIAETSANQSGYYAQACMMETRTLNSKLEALKVGGAIEIIFREKP